MKPLLEHLIAHLSPKKKKLAAKKNGGAVIPVLFFRQTQVYFATKIAQIKIQLSMPNHQTTNRKSNDKMKAGKLNIVTGAEFGRNGYLSGGGSMHSSPLK